MICFHLASSFLAGGWFHLQYSSYLVKINEQRYCKNMLPLHGKWRLRKTITAVHWTKCSVSAGMRRTEVIKAMV